MSLEDEIFSAIKGFFPAPVGNPLPYLVHPVTFPQSPAVPVVPACRYVFVSLAAAEDICGSDDDTSDPRTQIDILHKTYPGARALRKQVIAALGAIATPTRLAGGFDDYDSELKLFRCVVDFISYPSS